DGNGWIALAESLLRIDPSGVPERLPRPSPKPWDEWGPDWAKEHGWAPLATDRPNTESIPSDVVGSLDLGRVNLALPGRDGELWLGSESRGLLRITPRVVSAPGSQPLGWTIDACLPSFPSATLGVLVNGRYPAALVTEGGEVSLPAEIFPDTRTVGVGRARDGGLWISNNEGVVRYRDGACVQYRMERDEHAAVCYEDEDGSLWWLGSGGLFTAAPPSDPDSLIHPTVLPYQRSWSQILGQTSDGSIWIGSKDALTRVRDGSLHTFQTSDGLPPGEPRQIWEDAAGRLWFTTRGSGLVCLRDGTFLSCTTANGLPDDTLGGILEDDSGRLWINSNGGIFVVQTASLERFAVGSSHQVPCVLLSDVEGNRWASRGTDGRFYFETIQGVVTAYPELLPPPESPPVARIRGVEAGDRDYARTSLVALPRGLRNFEVHYTAPSLTEADFLRFRVRLEGIDDDWVEVGARRTAYFTHVPAGSHQFSVIAASSAGEWARVGDTMTIEVPAFLHETLAFRTGILIVLVLGLASAYGVRMRYLRGKFKAVEAEVRKRRDTERSLRRLGQRLMTAQEDERRHIAAELHDDVNQRLALLTVRLDLAGQKTPELTELGQMCRTVTEDLQRMSRMLHPAKLEQLGLAPGLAALCREISLHEGWEVTFDATDVPSEIPDALALCFYRVAQESLHNALKHSRSDRAEVLLSGAGTRLRLDIRDFGVGFDVEDVVRNGGIGLVSMRERAQSLGGDLAIESNPGAGTRIRLEAPLDGKEPIS
ncbi:MAG: hypothetical protein KC729_13615, partial [Candidatus Eisenbacteria bacterium]|nr:hypothetical protein [Candidatus Eisenbacteria bacterium]